MYPRALRSTVVPVPERRFAPSLVLGARGETPVGCVGSAVGPYARRASGGDAGSHASRAQQRRRPHAAPTAWGAGVCGRWLRWASCTMSPHRVRRPRLASGRRSPRAASREFHHGLLVPVLVLFAALPSSSAIARSADGHSIQDLADFGGCWRTEGASYMEEIWSAPTSNLMLGLTLFVREGRAVQYELTRVEVVGERIVMTPYPNGTASEHGLRSSFERGVRCSTSSPASRWWASGSS
jgi:hypothetical protein